VITFLRKRKWHFGHKYLQSLDFLRLLIHQKTFKKEDSFCLKNSTKIKYRFYIDLRKEMNSMQWQSKKQRLITLTLVIIFWSFSAIAQSFTTRPNGREKAGGDHPAVLRSQRLDHDFSGLKINQLNEGKKINLKLNAFIDVTIDAEIQLTKISGPNRGTFTGKDIKNNSEILISKMNDAVVIDIFKKNKHIQITPNKSGEYIAKEYDLDRFPSLLYDTLDATTSAVNSTTTTTPVGDSASIVDILVAFAADSATQVGGIDGATALADNAAAVFNIASINSHSGTQLRVVGVVITNYTSSGDLSLDLNRLISGNDGFMDEVTSAREFYKADIVSLISESGNYCGLGYMPGEFSATNRGCAVGNKSFAHEVGHNFGCGHDIENGGGVTAYANGYRFYGSDGAYYRTIMAYAPGARISYFSTPNVSYLGTPTGVVNLADNARRIIEYSNTIANIRQTATPSIGSTITFSTNSLNFGSISINEEKTLELTISNNGSAPLPIENLTITGSTFQSADKSNCLLVLAGFTSCKINIRFLSAAAGTFNEKLVIQASLATNNFANVILSGTAVMPAPNIVAPTSLTFSKISIGETNTQSLLISNNGTAPLLFSSITLVDLTGKFFVVSNNCQESGLQSGASCKIDLKFTSLVIGTFTAKLNLATNDPDQPVVTTSLSGSTIKIRGKK
jgi:preprotein translocase subunit SecE